MKKQILFVAMALFAATQSFGQVNTTAVTGSAPRGTGCEDDALHPIAGKPYTYTLEGTPTGGNFLWWATKNNTFVSTAADGTRTYNNTGTNLLTVANGDMVNVGTNYNVAGETTSISITWSDALLANTVYNTNPTFVTALYNNTTCADNLKVYQLDPIKAFTVDILSYNGNTALAYGAVGEQCIDRVSSAIFNGTTMNYLYGQNIFVYEVVAANFTGSYTPSFLLTGLNAVQTYTIQWTYDAPGTWGAGTEWHAATDPVTTNLLDTSNGVSIYVRVTVTNNNYEGLTAMTFDLAVDGMNTVGEYDVDNGDGTLCDQTAIAAADQADIAQQTFLPRPSLEEGTESANPPFIRNLLLVPGDSQNN